MAGLMDSRFEVRRPFVEIAARVVLLLDEVQEISEKLWDERTSRIDAWVPFQNLFQIDTEQFHFRRFLRGRFRRGSFRTGFAEFETPRR